MFQLEGIYAPIPIPFKEGTEGGIDYEIMKYNMDHLWNPSKLSGIVIMGSNGEFVYLTEQEKREVIQAVCSFKGEGKHVIAGCGCESTAATIDLCRYAASAGADAALVLNPNYYKKAMNDQVLETFFKDVADASPIPVILYNMPGNSGVNLSASLVKRLSSYPNIIGIKDSSGNIVQIMEILRDAPEEFSVFAGSASFLFPAAAAGAKGGTLALANVFPNECAKLYELTRAGEIERAKKLQLVLLEANAAVTGKFGIPGLKAALEMVGGKSGYPRKPLLPLPPEKYDMLKEIILKTQQDLEHLD